MDMQEENKEKKPTKGVKILVIIILILGISVVVVPVLGISLAIAIPALASAKAEAIKAEPIVVAAQKIVNGTEYIIQEFQNSKGHAPTSWAELEPYIGVNSQTASSPQEFLKLIKMPEGTKFNIRGVDGAKQTTIEFPNGTIVHTNKTPISIQ